MSQPLTYLWDCELSPGADGLIMTGATWAPSLGEAFRRFDPRSTEVPTFFGTSSEWGRLWDASESVKLTRGKPEPKPEPKPKLSQRMLRLARLLHLGALPLWDGWAHSRGRMDPVPDGARVYSPADGPEYAHATVLAIFAARPRIRKVIGVYDAMVLRETSRSMTGGEAALDYALALLESGEVSA